MSMKGHIFEELKAVYNLASGFSVSLDNRGMMNETWYIDDDKVLT